MANVFQDQPDARQADPGGPAPDASLFRKRYRTLTEEEVALHDRIKDQADALAGLIAQIIYANRKVENPMRAGSAEAMIFTMATNQGANVTLALRHLEDAVYRAVKALTA
jgi:hypothetical protein